MGIEGDIMMHANEQDVVEAFRQAVQEELRRAQEGEDAPRDVLKEATSLEDAVRLLNQRHEELRHEVALLRTILLRLVSEPVDEKVDEE
jgi:predicted  nucleic acid-binding Zn-ribbon protein